MRVLYALYEADTLSESYIRTELDWMEAKGVVVSVWAQFAHLSTYSDPRAEKIVGGDVREAIERFKPDLVHTHWLMAAKRVLRAVEAAAKPLTIRGHSFEFNPKDVAFLEASPAVRRIWLFPHFVAPGMSDRVQPLPVCYDERRYRPGGPRNRRKVFRASAGVKGKGLEELLEIASCVPELEFSLAVTRATDDPSYPDRIAALAPPNLALHVSLQHDAVAEQMRSSGLYFRNHDPGSHPYGMPISAAEAMGSGCVLLARNDPAALAFIGDAGLFYESVEEAVDRLARTLEWDEAEWRRRESISLETARRYRTDEVLPAVLEEWRRIVG